MVKTDPTSLEVVYLALYSMIAETEFLPSRVSHIDWQGFPRLHHKTRLWMWSETQLPKSACQVQFDSFTDRTTKNPLEQKLCLCNQGSENSSDNLRSFLSLSLSLRLNCRK